MKALLRIKGWEKIEDIPDYSIRSGVVELAFSPYFPDPSNQFTKPFIPTERNMSNIPRDIVYRLTFQGEIKNGLRVFIFE